MIIYTGRFQPLHNGHVALINELCRLYPQEVICVAIIKNVLIEDGDEFDKNVDSMLVNERNPFDSEAVLKMVSNVLKNRYPENVVTTLMPRASDSNFSIIKSLFNCERTWVFTENCVKVDDWENKKHDFFKSHGEKTIRIKIHKDIEGSRVRDLINSRNFDELKTMVPEEIFEYIVKM